MTLYKLIEIIKEIALKHPNIGSVNEGDIYTINSSPSVKYANITITQNQHTQDETYDHYGLTIFYTDRLVDDMETNRLQIQSVGKSMLSNIITFICEEFDIECDTITYQPFTQRFTDECAGIYASLTVDIVKETVCAEEYWNESWVAPIVSIRNQNKSVVFTENGSYTIDYDAENFTGLGTVQVDVQIPLDEIRDNAYSDGYANGKEDGYNSGRNDGYGEGKTDGVNEQKSKLESINITENGTYTREDGYDSITVEVPDLNGSFDEGYESGKTDGYNEGFAEGVEEGISNAGSIIAETARVLDITENGIYGSQYSDPIYPNVITGDFGDGNYFYDWADLVDESYFTDAYVTKDSKIEVWWKSKNNYNGDAYYIIVGAGSDSNFQIRTNSNGSGFWLEIGGQRVTYAPLVANEWYHIVLSAEGAYINGEKCGEFSNPYDFGEKQVCINTAPYIGVNGGRFANGTIGMVRVDDHIYIPTQDGFINYHTKEVLEKRIYGTYIFTENKIIWPEGNLIKTVNVNVVPKIDVNEYGLKFGQSTFSEIPEYFDFKNVTNMYRMFYYCGSLTTIPLIDTSKVTDMSYMFYNCGSLKTMPLIDTSKVSNMSNMFYSCGLTTIPQLDTSNVTDMSSMFYYCGSLKTMPLIDTSKVTNMSNMFYNCGSLTTIPQLDTSKVTNMREMFRNCNNLVSVPPLDARSVVKQSYGIFGNSNLDNLTDFGGLIGLKASMDGNYGFEKVPNLTYESCINILNGLYDFTGNGETPTSNEGKLKVHSNFLTTVGDEITIGTAKGWQISA